MPLADGDPADGADTWLRVLTDKAYLLADGTIHNKAFSGRKALAPPDPQKHRNWAHEMSGRLLSLAGNVGDEAREFCDGQQREFAGVAYALVVALRTRHHHISTDVCYTPLDRDSAHADVVFFQSNDDDKEMLRDWLQTVLKALRPDEIGALES